MRRTRRRRNQWFPVLGVLDADEQLSVGYTQMLSVASTGAVGQAGNAATTTLVPDFTPEDLSGNADNTLADLVGHEYIIERIVGKAHFGLRQDLDDPPTTDQAVIFALGLFVARVGDDGVNPIGDLNQVNADYGPLNPRTYQRPWMWRRTWALSVNATTDPDSLLFPATTSQGSVADGPHIDCKSKRRVRKDERLFVAIQAGTLNGVPPPGGNGGEVQGVLDIRLLGRLVKPRNTSAF